MELIKNDVIECPIDALGIHGEGIAHVEGKTVFIRGALPGERVRGRIVFARPAFCDALLTEVLEPSPDRVEPDCPVYGKCGGCALRHMTYAAELAYKRDRLAETFRKVAGLDVRPLDTVPSAGRTRCRNKLSLPVRQGKDGPAVGFFAANTHRVVETDDCLLQPKWNAKLIAFVKRFIRDNGLTAYDEQAGTGNVRHIVAREVGGQLYIILVVTDIDNPKYTRFPAQLQFHLSRKAAIYLNENKRQTNAILGGRFLRLTALPPVAVGGVVTDVHPAGFFQVNDYIREKLYADVCAAIPGGTVIDAYAGAGLLTAALAAKCDKVYGVELDPAAAASAEQTVRLNDITNMETVRGDCAEVLPRLITGEESAVILDPPRSGCDERVLHAAAGAKKILYISCNPPTLARDVKILVDEGFSIVSARAYDMFPGTAAMESLTILQRDAAR